MRRVFLIIVILLFSTAGFSYDRGHVFISGIIQSFNNEKITVELENGNIRSFDIEPGCRIMIPHKMKATVSDLRVGDKVYLKKIANTVEEIVVER